MSESYHAVQLPLFTSIEHTSPNCACIGKYCTQCHVTRCIGCFHRFIHSKDGFRSECKLCRKAKSETEEFKAKKREYHTENADQINATKRTWYHANPERARDYSKKSRQRYPEKVEAYQHEYNRSEQGKQRWLEYRTNHPERVAQFSKAWKESHPEMVQEHAKVRDANYKAKKLGIPGKITVQQWREIKALYGCICLRCGKQEPEITLTLDHVIPFALRGINTISNVQPLCEFCNTSKGVKVIDYRQDTSA